MSKTSQAINSKNREYWAYFFPMGQMFSYCNRAVNANSKVNVPKMKTIYETWFSDKNKYNIKRRFCEVRGARREKRDIEVLRENFFFQNCIRIFSLFLFFPFYSSVSVVCFEEKGEVTSKIDDSRNYTITSCKSQIVFPSRYLRFSLITYNLHFSF